MTQKNLTLCGKTHSMGPSKQVRHEYLIRKKFLLRVNHDNNRKKKFFKVGAIGWATALLRLFRSQKLRLIRRLSENLNRIAG